MTWNCLISLFAEDANTRQQFANFFRKLIGTTLSKPEKFANIWQIEQNVITKRAMNFQTAWVHFLKDVSVTFVAFVA